ncbi:MAG: hypothetical protein PHR92_16140 [Lachnospiraceae bacterium]|nr:hypothetical protein [Lachnospiraceae bacterium]
MKSIEEIKEDRRMEIKELGMGGGHGIIHMPGLKYCTVIFSMTDGWEHVSVCPRNRTPNWDEMCAVKDIFWREDETVVQFHPAKSEYVNIMDNCLHLWRPIKGEIVVPPMTLA